ncbi:XRE family transcriptional regulator [Lachnospiraceae bacterium]|jgi:transcriptional regulator with XRE-family HTH domain|nr:XRE family transcriptional regulator [Lachnospiraceae bacterium]
MRKNLKEARQKAGMTQKQVAEYIHTAERYYKQIEYGERLGSIAIWDMLEDLFSIHQRKLREISKNHRDKGDNL